jgi:hypothetical protein
MKLQTQNPMDQQQDKDQNMQAEQSEKPQSPKRSTNFSTMVQFFEVNTRPAQAMIHTEDSHLASCSENHMGESKNQAKRLRIDFEISSGSTDNTQMAGLEFQASQRQ